MKSLTAGGLMKRTKCPRCEGSGSLATPNGLRALRDMAGLSLSEVARRMGISAPYLCQIENGGRNINADFEARFLKALQ